MNQHNWPDVAIALIPVLILVFQYYQSLQAKRIEAKVENVDKKVDEKTSAIETKVDDNNAVVHETKLLVNSSSQIQMELRIVDLKELLAEKPDNISVLARLEAAEKLLADHKTKDAVMKDRGRSVAAPPSLGSSKPIVVQRVEEPVEIKTKS